MGELARKLPVGNFIRHYIEYAECFTDAAEDYHLAHGMVLMSAATNGLKIRPIPGGPWMGTNIYCMIYGVTTNSRKSYCMEIAKRVMNAAGKEWALPEQFSPEGLVETLAERSEASIMYQDEFTTILEGMLKQKYMAPLRGILLQLYKDRNLQRRLASQKKGAEGGDRTVEVKDAHLSLIGNVTPAIGANLKDSWIEDGFLNRMLIVLPNNREKVVKIDEIEEIGPDEINRLDGVKVELAGQLREISAVCKRLSKKRHNVFITREAMTEFGRLETYVLYVQKRMDDIEASILSRIVETSFKVAALVAASNLDYESNEAVIGEKEAAIAVEIMRLMVKNGRSFAEKLGGTEARKNMEKVERHLYSGPLERGELASKCRFSAQQMKETLADLSVQNRIRIELKEQGDGAKPISVISLRKPPLLVRPIREEKAPTQEEDSL